MHAALAMAFAAAAMGATDVRLDVGVRTEGRATTYAPGDRAAATVTAAEISPHLGAALQDGGLRLGAAYDVRLRAADLSVSAEPTVTQGLELRGVGRIAPTVELAASAGATRGRTDPLRDLWAPGEDPASQPTASLRFELVRARVAPSWTVSRLTSAAASASAARSCGLGAEGRARLPCQESAALESSVSVRLSERDRTRVSATASRTRTTGAADSGLGTASVEQRRDLTRRASLRALAGASVTAQTAPGTDRTWSIAPVGELGLALAHRALTVDLSARTSPSVHRGDGGIRHYASGSASVRWAPAPGWLASASVLESVAWRGAALRLTALELRIAWTPWPGLRLEVGALARRQEEPAATPSLHRETAGFVSLLADAPTIR